MKSFDWKITGAETWEGHLVQAGIYNTGEPALKFINAATIEPFAVVTLNLDGAMPGMRYPVWPHIAIHHDLTDPRYIDGGGESIVDALIRQEIAQAELRIQVNMAQVMIVKVLIDLKEFKPNSATA